MNQKVKNYEIKTVTPFAREYIANNVNTETTAAHCCMVEVNAARDVITATINMIAHFCPHKEVCGKRGRYHTCTDVICDHMRERMQYIKDNGNLTLGEKFRV